MKKTVCFFGSYNQTHRNNSLIQGLREQGHTVLECRDDSMKLLRYIRLFKKHWKIRKEYDVLFVCFPNHGLVPFVKMLTRKPIIFDPFISLYNTIVEDRTQKPWYSPKALRAFCLDFLSVRLSDWVLTDTRAHGQYFSETFGASIDKFVTVPVGTNTFFINANNMLKEAVSEEFKVKFYGTYSPLQGVQHIVRAAKILQEERIIHFYLIGHGQTLREMTALAEELQVTNITFIEERVPLTELVDFVNDADVSLGIFGGTLKSQMVVPHKVYDALALKKPVLTADTPAVREFFENRRNILLCNDADPEDLAAKILELKNDRALCQKIGEEGYQLLQNEFTPKQIVKNILPLLN